METKIKNSCYSIPHQITLSWSNLTIRAQINPKKKFPLNICSEFKAYETILSQVKGVVEPGEILALMGSSGSGKTTLLNALNFSTSDKLMVEGRIMLNGCEADSVKMSMVSCYIQQDDLFFGTLTVREHLVFQAMLRMDQSMTRESKLKRVNQVLKEFNLDRRANVRIGIPGRIKGISGGEKRRLAFASEILTDPQILFCDEPTSGLDSKMAKSIVFYLKKLAQKGKTIICTIHQPSSETFAIFDKICLLSQTKVAFFGSREDALKFFENNLHLKFPPFTNPADFYMDALGVDVNDAENSRAQIQNYCDKFTKSEYNLELSKKIESVKPISFNSPPNYTSYKSTWSEQMRHLLQRSFLSYIRNRKVVLNDILMVFVTALLGGSIYYQTGKANNSDNCRYNQQSIQNVSFALFYTITVSVIFCMLAAVMAFPNEIPIYFREHKASVYRSDTYYLSKFLVELPVYLILPAIHATVIYYMVGFNCDKNSFSVFLLTDILISNAAYSLGHILSVSTSDANLAISLTSPFIAIQMLFSGFFLRRAVRTPAFLTFIKYGSIFNYGYDLLMLNQWENVQEIECEYDIELLCLTTGGSVLNEENVRRVRLLVGRNFEK
uniref:ATP-binding cassette transporter subfamily G-like8 protein n=1 Tax=Brachionus koreanus TaxID=1199090 RepID=A0A1J0MMV2_9BILA|nr:ATP-binding cassette transporter subfamily G-like8 protein [Brachionus koreanus]